MATSQLQRSLGALAALAVLLVLLVGGRRSHQSSFVRPSEGGDEMTALVDQVIADRWQTMERQLRADLAAELGLAFDPQQETEAQDERHLKKVRLASFDVAIKALQISFDQVRADMSTLTTEIDGLRARLKREKRARTSAIAYFGDQLDEEMSARQKSVKQLEDELRGQVDKLHEGLAAVRDDVNEAATSTTTNATTSISTNTTPPLTRTAATRYNSVISNPVLSNDTILVPPKILGTIIAPITGYSWTGSLFAGFNESLYERPIYKNISRDSDDFWKYLVDELLLSRAHAIMLGNRGCYKPNVPTDASGPGYMCPRTLSRFVDAVYRAGAQNVIRVGMWDDTGSYFDLNGLRKLDLSNQTHWGYFWDYKIKIFYDVIPKDLWFYYPNTGKPVIAAWSLSDAWFLNQQGNASVMINWLSQQFTARYGMAPLFILQDNWFKEDTTMKANVNVLGQQSWFSPVSDVPTSIYSYTQYNNRTWGVTTPGYRNSRSLAGCGSSCREVTRRNGTTLLNALNAGKAASMTLLEGWTDMSESAGFYRSSKWWYPNQYINIVRSFADPEPETLQLQAEAADAFYDTTVGNAGGEYALRDLDVGALSDGSGWFVGWIDAGEWIEFQQVQLGCGTYRFTVRATTDNDGRVISLGLGTRKLTSITLPYTGPDNYMLFNLAEVQLPKGTYNLRLNFETAGNLKLDWLFVKRTRKQCTAK